MPCTTHKGGSLLQIDLASHPAWIFAPGDTIIGTITRRMPIVTPSATITVTLIGRVKTKISVRRQSGQRSRTDHYRGRWLLVGRETQQVLHQGPLHLAQSQHTGSEVLSWPFSVQIPTRPASSLVQQQQVQSFLPLSTIATHPLPGTFYCHSPGLRTSSEGFIEYYLESVLQYSRGGSFETCTATYPFTMQQPSLETLSPTPALHQSRFPAMARTQRLFPGMDQAELSLKQKTQKFFHSSKVPTFGYAIEVCTPQAMQLENPHPIPLIVQVIQNPETTSPEIRDTPQKIQLDWVRMLLKSTTDVIAPGNFMESHTHDDHNSSSRNLGLEMAFRSLEKAIVFESNQENQRVDLGEALQLILRPEGLYARNRLLSQGAPIYPDFVTYNIKYAHQVALEISVTVAGETTCTKVQFSTRILPPVRVVVPEPQPPEYSQK